MSRAARAAALILLAAAALGGCATLESFSASGYDAAAARMLAAGTDPNRRGSDGSTPLIAAVSRGRVSTTQLLLAHLADPNRPDARGATPLAFAVRNGLPKIAELLLDAGALVDKPSAGGRTPLTLAVRAADAPMIGLLVRRGASLSAPGSNGDGALLTAVRGGRLDVVKLLLSLGADANAPDRTGQTPAEVATYANRPDLLAALEASGAKPVGVQGRLGLILGADKSGLPAVAAVEAGSPAAVAGIAVGDKLLQVDYQPVAGWTLAQMTAHLRGAAGTGVNVTVRRGGRAPATYTLVRQAVGLQAPDGGAPTSARTFPPDVDAPAAAAERPDDYALVIGIDDYQALPRADFAVRDAESVRRDFAALGVPFRNIAALEGSAATKGKLESYLRDWLPKNVRPDSNVYVYFSGNGAPDPATGEAFLVPWDGDPMLLTSTAYPLKRFYADLADLKARRVFVALDAGFSGAGGRSVLERGAAPLSAKVDDAVPAAENLTVLSAAYGDETAGALDAQGHGVFTYFLLKGLSGDARNADGNVTPKSLSDYLKPRVQDEARRGGREQIPTLTGDQADEPLARF